MPCPPLVIRRYAAILSTVVGLALLCVTACTPMPSSAAAPTVLVLSTLDPAALSDSPANVGVQAREPGMVRVNLGLVPGALDPAHVGPLDASGSDLVANLFAGLASIDSDDGHVEPMLAQRWEQLDDGRTWYVYLRDDIFWTRVDPQSGSVQQLRPVTAADVVFAVRRTCRAQTGAPLGARPLIFLIEGCRDIYEQDTEALTLEYIDHTLGVRALNDIVVEFKLVADSALFPTLLAMPMLFPVPPELIEAQGTQWTDWGTIWTSGPYAVQPTALPEGGIRLVANPFWPLERNGNVEVVQISFDSEGEEAFRAWQSGSLDLTVISEHQLATAPFGSDPAYRLLALPATVFLAAQYDAPPLNNADLRRALSLALDREEIVQEVLLPNGYAALPAYTVIPPGMVAASDQGDASTGFDPAAARAALERAGYPGCNGLPPMTLLVGDASSLPSQLALALVNRWEEVLGCHDVFTITRQPLFDLYATLQNPPPTGLTRPGLVVLGWEADYPDTHHWLGDLLGCHEFFPTAYLDQARPCLEADGQVLDAMILHDEAERAARYATAEATFFGPTGEMPVIPVYFYARPLAVHPWVAVSPRQAGPLRFDRWVISEE